MSRPVVFDYVDTVAHGRSAPNACGSRWSARDWKAPPVERFALDAAADAHAAARSRGAASARWCWMA
jgi:hypothetical protein